MTETKYTGKECEVCPRGSHIIDCSFPIETTAQGEKGACVKGCEPDVNWHEEGCTSPNPVYDNLDEDPFAPEAVSAPTVEEKWKTKKFEVEKVNINENHVCDGWNAGSDEPYGVAKHCNFILKDSPQLLSFIESEISIARADERKKLIEKLSGWCDNHSDGLPDNETKDGEPIVFVKDLQAELSALTESL